MCTRNALQNWHVLYVYSECTAELTRFICVLRRHCRTATLYMCIHKTPQNCHAQKAQQNCHVLKNVPSEGTAELPRWCVLGNLLECEKEEKFNNSFNKTCCLLCDLLVNATEKAALSHAELTNDRGPYIHRPFRCHLQCGRLTWPKCGYFHTC
jgi:hypothetical protein